MTNTGEIDFTGKEPPQTYIYCGVCDSRVMMCGCKALGYGKDYIFKGLPAPSSSLSRIGLLRRFASIASILPATRPFDSVGWHRDWATTLSASMEARTFELGQMVDEYIESLPSSDMLHNLALCLGGQPLQQQPRSVQCTIIANECRAALASFISGDWATVTKIGVTLLHNAFEVSDPTRFRLDDPHLMTIFESGIDYLSSILKMGYSDYTLALECDRPPQVETDQPILSVNDRGYSLNNVNA